jgi:hypothetical protein
MKTKYFIAGIVAGIVVGLLIGYNLGSRWTQKQMDQLRAELFANYSGIDENKAVNMSAALDQVQKEAQRRGVELAELKARDTHTVQFRIVNGPEVSLQWRDMGEDTAISRQNLESKFNNLMAVMKRSNEVPVKNVDMNR